MNVVYPERRSEQERCPEEQRSFRNLLAQGQQVYVSGAELTWKVTSALDDSHAGTIFTTKWLARPQSLCRKPRCEGVRARV